MTETFKNADLKRMLNSLELALTRKGKLGYAAARNARKIQDALTEYNKIEENLFLKYGKKEVDEDGKKTGRISIDVDAPDYDAFLKEIGQFLAIEHEVDIMKLRYQDVSDDLTGEEMLAISWMLVDELEG